MQAQHAQESPATAPEGLGDTPADASTEARGNLARQLAEQDAQLRQLAFAGGTIERVRMTEAHLTAMMRKAESRDPRTALAAAKLILQAHELAAKLAGETAPEVSRPRATVVIFSGDHDAALAKARSDGRIIDGSVVVALPDNGRGDGPDE